MAFTEFLSMNYWGAGRDSGCGCGCGCGCGWGVCAGGVSS